MSFLFSFRIRKLSLSLLGPDEDRPLVNQAKELTSNQQRSLILIEHPEQLTSNENAEQCQETSSNASNRNNDDTTKM